MGVARSVRVREGIVSVIGRHTSHALCECGRSLIRRELPCVWDRKRTFPVLFFLSPMNYGTRTAGKEHEGPCSPFAKEPPMILLRICIYLKIMRKTNMSTQERLFDVWL